MDYEVGGGWYSTHPHQILKRTWRRPDNSHRKFALQITNPRRRRVSKVWQTYFKERMTFEWLYDTVYARIILTKIGTDCCWMGSISKNILNKVDWLLPNGPSKYPGTCETELKWHPQEMIHILEVKTRWEQRLLNKLPMRHTFRKDTVMRWLT